MTEEKANNELAVAVTADIHWGLSAAGDRSTRALVRVLEKVSPDVVVLAGDTGAGEALEKGLSLFRHLPAQKLLIAGNHDLWALEEGMDSLELYSHDLARAAAAGGFKYLDDGPWIAPDRSLAVVGSVNWYDYSFAPPAILKKYPNAQEIFERKLFTKSRHNDGRFIKFGMSDEEFTGLIVKRVEEHLQEASQRAEAICLVTHHPAIPELFRPLPPEPEDDDLIWGAYMGNVRMRDLVMNTPKVRYVFSGHTHIPHRARAGRIEAVNVGSDYQRKMLALLHHPSGQIGIKGFPPEAEKNAT
ncbi:MAG: metallophosphoesterase [Planctomycetota bacterium]